MVYVHRLRQIGNTLSIDFCMRKGGTNMSKQKTIDAKMQSRIDNQKEAMNSTSGFKTGMSSGTHGAGDSYRNKQ